jgi:predicted outer membrane repeat protein
MADANAANAAAAGGVLLVPQKVPTLQQAIAVVGNGGVIEIAAGVYAAPAAGFRIADARKGFTIRAALGATVVLDGGGSHPVLVLRNSAASRGGLVVFENLVFRNGGGGSSTESPGVTVDTGEARFVGCTFENNVGAAGAGGGGAKIRNGSTVSFLGCTFAANSSPVAGGAILIDVSSVEVLGGSFLGNLVNLPGSAPSSQGGAINAVDSTLQVSDTLFQGNQAGWVGGAIYAIGTWTPTPAIPHTSVSITRSTFQGNAAAPQPCCPPPGEPTGGAIHVEDQTTLDVVGSSFVDNQAQFGGALDSYRALINVAGSTFQGNGGNVAGSGLAVGGAICATSNDLVDGTTANGQNPRPAGVTVAGSLLQGSQPGGGPVGNAGGCILAAGDAQHLYGLGGLTPDGTLASNQASLQISGSVFADCDVQQSPTVGGGSGGAINGSLVALTVGGSLVLSSAAAGDGLGGGIFLNDESDAQISQTTFAGNSADTLGGAIYASGSNVEISGGSFIANQAGSGAAGPLSAARGAALVFTPLPESQPHVGSGNASGLISAAIFSQNLGLPVWDVDAGGASLINTVQYGANGFFTTTFGGDVYEDTFADPQRRGFTVGGLNSLVVTRSGGPATVKSTVANVALAAPPSAGSLVAIPPAGSPSARSASFLAYAWTGFSATLNGEPLPLHDGLIESPAAGSYTLAVDGRTAGAATIAAAGCTFDPILCLASARFHIQVQWDLPTGESGDGHPIALSDDTGTFWFFDPANVELVVKIVDGRALNGCFWVFYGALSNVGYTLMVTDTVTGAVNAYVNPQGQLASIADTSAFLGTGNAPPVPPVTGPPPPAPGSCAATPGELCLGNRFRVDVAWRTRTAAGKATAVPLTGDTGYLWFFSAAEVDLVVKILDGRSINGDFWVFYGALSNVEYTIKITDSQSGRTKTYVNPQGTLASVADTSALRGP